MSISTVLTLGYGSFGGVRFLPTLGYTSSGVVPPPTPSSSAYNYGGIGWQLALNNVKEMEKNKEKRDRLRRRKRKVALLLAKLLADSED